MDNEQDDGADTAPPPGTTGPAGEQEPGVTDSSGPSSPTFPSVVPANSWQLRVGSRMRFKAVPWSKAPWSRAQLARQSILKLQTVKQTAAKQPVRRRPFSAAAQRWWISKSQMASDRANFVAASALDEDMVVAAVAHALQRTQLLAQQSQQDTEVHEQAPPQTAWDFMLDVFDEVRNEAATVIQRAYRQHLAARRHLQELATRRYSDGSKDSRSSLKRVNSRYMEGVLPGTSRRQSQIGSHDGSHLSTTGQNKAGTTVSTASNLTAAAFQSVVQRATNTPTKIKDMVAKPIQFAELPPMEKARRALAPMLRHVYEVAAQLLAQSKGTDLAMAAAAAALRVHAGSPGPDKLLDRSVTASPDLMEKPVQRIGSSTVTIASKSSATATKSSTAVTDLSAAAAAGRSAADAGVKDGNIKLEGAGMNPNGTDTSADASRMDLRSEAGSPELGAAPFEAHEEEDAFIPVQRSPTFLSLMFGQNMGLVQSITLAADAHGAAGMLQAIREQADNMQVDVPVQELQSVPQMRLIQQLMQQAEDVRAVAQGRREDIASEYMKHVERIAEEAERVKHRTEQMLQPREAPAREPGWRERARSVGEEEYRRMVSAANRTRRVEQGLTETEASVAVEEAAAASAAMGDDHAQDGLELESGGLQLESKLKRARSRAAAKQQQAAVTLRMRQAAAVMAAVSRTRRSIVALASKNAAPASPSHKAGSTEQRTSLMGAVHGSDSGAVSAPPVVSCAAAEQQEGLQGNPAQPIELIDSPSGEIWPKDMADAGVSNLKATSRPQKLVMSKQRPAWGIPAASFNAHAGWTNDWGPLGCDALHDDGSRAHTEASRGKVTLKPVTIGGGSGAQGPGQEGSSKRGWYYDAWGLPVLVRGGTLEAMGPIEPIEPQWQAKPAPTRAPPTILPRLLDPARNKSLRTRRQALMEQARVSTPRTQQDADLQLLSGEGVNTGPESVHQRGQGSWVLDPAHAQPGSPHHAMATSADPESMALRGQGLLDTLEQDAPAARQDSYASTLLPALSLSGQGPLQIELPQEDPSSLLLQGRVMAQCSPRSRSFVGGGNELQADVDSHNNEQLRRPSVLSAGSRYSLISQHPRAGSCATMASPTGLQYSTASQPTALQYKSHANAQQGGSIHSSSLSGTADTGSLPQAGMAGFVSGAAMTSSYTLLPCAITNTNSPCAEPAPDRLSADLLPQDSLPPLAATDSDEQLTKLPVSGASAMPAGRTSLPSCRLLPTCTAPPEPVFVSSTSEGGTGKRQASTRVWRSQIRAAPAGLMLGPSVSSTGGANPLQHAGPVSPPNVVEKLPHTPHPQRQCGKPLLWDRTASSDSGAVLVRVPGYSSSPLCIVAGQHHSHGGGSSGALHTAVLGPSWPHGTTAGNGKESHQAKLCAPFTSLKGMDSPQTTSAPTKAITTDVFPPPVLQSLVVLQPSKLGSWYEPGSIRKAGALSSRLAQYQKGGSAQDDHVVSSPMVPYITSTTVASSGQAMLNVTIVKTELQSG